MKSYSFFYVNYFFVIMDITYSCNSPKQPSTYIYIYIYIYMDMDIYIYIHIHILILYITSGRSGKPEEVFEKKNTIT